MLKYTGKGFLAGVPAKDLTDEQAKQYGVKRLLESGLYTKIKDKKTVKETVEKDG